MDKPIAVTTPYGIRWAHNFFTFHAAWGRIAGLKRLPNNAATRKKLTRDGWKVQSLDPSYVKDAK